MKYLKFIVLTLLIMGNGSVLLAQDYTVNKKVQRINNAKYEGFSISINGPLDKVTDQVYRYVKNTSKIRRKRNYFSIAEFSMRDIALDSTIVFLKFDEKENTTSVWMCIKSLNLEDDRKVEIENALNNELVLIARSYYVHEQEIKIKQSETAAQVISKKQQGLINENTSLTSALKSAEDRKIELETLLEENMFTIEVLKQKLIDNKFNQDSTYLDLLKINRVIEGQKKKLKEID